MQMTISAAARLYGIHRATLHRHIKSGRLSCVFKRDGGRTLDLSELIRCYGEPPHHSGDVRQDATGLISPPATLDATPGNAALLARFDALLEVVTEQRDELRALREEIRELRSLPAPEQLADDNRPQPPVTDEPDSTPPRDFSEVLARFEARHKPD